MELNTFAQLQDFLIDTNASQVLLKKATFTADLVLKENTAQMEQMNMIVQQEQTTLPEVFLLASHALQGKSVMSTPTLIALKDSTMILELVLRAPLDIIVEIM